MDNTFAISKGSAPGPLTHIMGTSSPRAIRKPLFPPMDVDMPVASVPSPIQTQLQSPMSDSTLNGLPPSVGTWGYDPSVIPPSHEARTLVLCFDGTGDQFDEDNSNIVQFVSMLKKDDKRQQLVYYQAGIGTYTIPEIATPFMAKVKKTIDMAIGNHLDAHVMGGYEFLMEHYNAGDRICIFGFSRGAYTARALAGMIHKVGLLPAGNHQQVPFAYKMFSRNDDTGWNQSKAFKNAFSVDVEIEFIGVWDTVCSVGLIPHTLPFVHSNTAIRHFRHAISLDERRAKFKANHWHVRDQKGTECGEAPRSSLRRFRYRSSRHHTHHHNKDAEEENDGGREETDVREVWFAGCHCDVGGGSVKNGTRQSLARIPLRWMIRECFRTNTGIQFYRESIKEVGLDPDTLYDTFENKSLIGPRPPAITPTAARVAEVRDAARAAKLSDATRIEQVQASPTAATTFKSEEEEEFADALSEIHDRLKESKAWWILEILPMRHHKMNWGNNEKDHYWKINSGRGRKVPKPIHEERKKILVHRSVKIRMGAEELEGSEYKPKAKFPSFDPDLAEWVD